MAPVIILRKSRDTRSFKLKSKCSHGARIKIDIDRNCWKQNNNNRHRSRAIILTQLWFIGLYCDVITYSRWTKCCLQFVKLDKIEFTHFSKIFGSQVHTNNVGKNRSSLVAISTPVDRLIDLQHYTISWTESKKSPYILILPIHWEFCGKFLCSPILNACLSN